MSEDKDGDPKPERSIDEEPQARRGGESKNATAGASDPQSAADGRNNGGGGGKYRAVNFLRRLSINEWLTLLVGVGSLVVSYLTYRNAADTRDLKNAVSNISILASQTKREADAMNAQFGQIKRQADALADQVDQMKRQAKATEAMATNAQSQTRAIAQQTVAIRNSSAAEIASSHAQEQSAQAETAARKPALVFSSLELDPLKIPPEKDGFIHGAFRAHFKNIGGATISNPTGIIHLIFKKNLPERPDPTDMAVPIGGNDISILQGAEFFPSDKVQYVAPKEIVDSVLDNKIAVFLYGNILYHDTEGATHSYCFAYQFPVKDGQPTGFYFSTGSKFYHCDD